MTRLSRTTVAALQLPTGRSEIIVFDEGLPGFGLRVRAGGKRTWIAQYRVGLSTRRLTLGSIDKVDPDEARKLAKAALARAQLGGDPQTEKIEARARAALTLAAVAERYLRHAHGRLKTRSFEEVERSLTRHWAPLGKVPVDRFSRTIVAARLTDIAVEHGPFAANRARAYLSGLFTWAMREGLAQENPVIGTNKPIEERSRDRVLSDDELATVWRACREDDYGRIVRLLILTGQRREEAGAMGHSEIDLTRALWSLPRQRTKNGLPHEVPLSRTALEILGEQPRRNGRTLVFGEGQGGFSGWGKAKLALDSRIAAAGAAVAPWRLHDLRRTVATGMAEIGVPPHVVEAVLNHLSGHKAGVAGIYNRARYVAEKRQALDMWAQHVLALTEGPKPPSYPEGSVG
jgi:integrase